jgi:GntR family transcriptional regulator
MLICIDPGAEAPLFAQIAGQLRRSIVEKRLAHGERLPSAKELAASLDVNMHTVLRAYDLLRTEGLLEVRRGRGVVVTSAGAGRAKLFELAHALVAESVRQGLNRHELVQLLENV